MASSSPAIAELQARWHTLQDLDRAYALLPIIESGESRRNLARALNCSESLLRHLLHTLHAAPEDRELARHGSISTNELVRRGRGRVQQTEPGTERALISSRITDAQQGAAIILDWLKAEPARAYYAYAIIQQAIAVLDRPVSTARLRDVRLRPDTGADELIEACRPVPSSEASNGSGPADTVDQLLGEISHYGFWLANYVFSLMVEPNVRREALNRALRQVPAPGRKAKLW